MAQLHLERLPRTVELVREGDRCALRFVDQRLLPDSLKIVQSSEWREIVDAVKTLAIRGAPAIGLAGASALAVWAAKEGATAAFEEFRMVAEAIASARPTAVNLRWAIDRACSHVEASLGQGTFSGDCALLLFELVKHMEAEDEQRNRVMGAWGASLIAPDSGILTHCNAGSLATSFYGTALGVVYAAAAQGKVRRVYADETRPIGQGARLTIWELSRVCVPTTLICDNMAASLMATGAVDAVLVGADRIARNGDVANKIGTYGVAILAHELGIPFYVVAPTSSIDESIPDGSCIPIEQRDSLEVLPRPLKGVDVWNPAFDITPARFVSAIVTEEGVFPPDGLFNKDA